MEEMAEGAAVLVAPGDTGALADALDQALGAGADDTGRAERRQHGLEVAARRTWQASAAIHLDAYRHALDMSAR
jgi:hypothetical protein